MRPCIEFNARLEVCHSGGWLAMFGDKFWVHGDTPAEAMDNFDKAWVEGNCSKRLEAAE